MGIWCLSGSNLTFGFCTGYMNGYVNGSFAKPNPVLTDRSIGMLLAIMYAMAAALSVVFSRFSGRTGWCCIVLLGSLCYACIALAVILVTPSIGNRYWGAWLVLLYILQGTGRAVYEGTNKAVFATFFPGDKSPGAFANSMLQTYLAFFASYVLQSILEDEAVLAWIILLLAALTTPGLQLAFHLQSKAMRDPYLSEPFLGA